MGLSARSVALANIALRYTMIAAAGVLAMGLAATASAAVRFTTIHKFCRTGSCADGGAAFVPLVQDSNGVFYGVTSMGGGTARGVVYSLTPDGRKYRYNVLYSFCPDAPTCVNGRDPEGPLAIDTNGNLYGTTFQGGRGGWGTVFELVHNADRTQWQIVTLHHFCRSEKGNPPCLDGSNPIGSLAYAGSSSGAPYDGHSPLYGTTYNGGANENMNTFIAGGTIFEVKQVRGQWRQKVLYNFCNQSGCADGNIPHSVVMGPDGKLYGGTANYGAHGLGTVYSFDPKSQTYGVLYNFCAQANCADGAYADAPLTFDAQGNIFGTTNRGGASNNGVVYRLSPRASGWRETVLHSFCQDTTCSDGEGPLSGVILDARGNLYGTTQYGGAYAQTNCDQTGYGCGVLFRMHRSTYTVLHSFCEDAASGCPDGAQPYGVTLDSAGNLLGVTSAGGATNWGTIYRVKP